MSDKEKQLYCALGVVTDMFEKNIPHTTPPGKLEPKTLRDLKELLGQMTDEELDRKVAIRDSEWGDIWWSGEFYFHDGRVYLDEGEEVDTA